jgi:DNA-binding response OmpR family regulator
MGNEAGPTVLAVDDDKDYLRIVELILKRSGIGVLSAPGGREALEAIRGPGKFDLVILDLMMPGIDGFQVLSELRASPERGDVPVLVLSAVIDPLLPERLLRLGADDFINKSYETKDFVSKVRAMLAGPRHARAAK